MSDASYSAVSRRLKKLDVVDDDWVCDRLSDDEIDVPKEAAGALGGDEEDGDSLLVDQEEKWGDLGLDRFVLEQQPQAFQGGPARGAQLPPSGADTSS